MTTTLTLARRARWLGVAVAIALTAAPPVFAAGSPTALARIDAGSVSGVTHDGVTAFKGVPFAQPPVGALRWQAPQPVAAWRGVRDASHYGPDCMQEPFPGDAAPLGETPAEDCLYLNVWRPAGASANARLPVMVWIYGGGFVNGGASPAVYDGSQFAKGGVVLVSFNYRLGHLGFFAHPALSAEQRGAPLANYGLMDQIAALQWVRRNIGAFGGDAGNVTVFGESAGGMSVHVLLTTPLARGLMHKAIIESGGGRAGLRDRPLTGGEDSAEGRGLAFAAKYGITGTGPDALAKLRAIPAQTIVKGLHMMTMGKDPTYVGGPVVDGRIVVGGAGALYEKGQWAKVPVMVGATSADIGGDQMMIEPSRYIARTIAAQGVPAYQFRFGYVAHSMRDEWPGALHATEIPYVFDTVAARYGKDLAADDAAMARTTHAYWVAFAKTGKPQAPGQPDWPAYEASGDRILDFTNEGVVAGADPWRARLDVAERAVPKR